MNADELRAQQKQARKVKQQQQRIAQQLAERQRERDRANMVNTIAYKSLSKWSIEGLDMSDSGFAKLHDKESKFEDDKKQYDLAADKFKRYVDNPKEKVNRIHAKKTFSIKASTTVTYEVLKHYSTITEAQMTTNRQERWPATRPTHSNQSEADQYTDEQIKASTIGNYIHESLTEAVREQLRADSASFVVQDHEGNAYYDGPSYFYFIAHLVDPDNGHLVDAAKQELRTLDVKNYGYSVQKMLADFKNLRSRVDELGGTYSSDDQFLDLWQCLKTMREKEFTRFVKQVKDEQAMKDRAARDSVDKIITIICAKQTRMESDKEWNVMSPEDSMVLALVGLLDSKQKNGKTNNSKKKSNNKDSKDSDKSDEPKKRLSDEEYKKLKESRIADWKKQSPKSGESKSKEVDGRTYHFCSKCREGEGMWVLHKEADHKDNFKQVARPKSAKSKSDKKKSDKKPESGNDPAIQVNKQLLDNAKSYLASLGSDFTQGAV